MKCKVCGKENYDDARFCKYCGSPLEEINLKQSIDSIEQKIEDKSSFATASMVLGIISLVFGTVLCCFGYISYIISFVTGCLSIIFAIISWKSLNKKSAVTGLICAIIGVTFTLIFAIYSIFFAEDILKTYFPEIWDQYNNYSN